jgi:putative transcriptional regulator
MDLLNPRKHTGISLASGKLLIAEPFLGDPGFSRSVVVLCEHSAEGSVGFILNHPTELTLSDLLADVFTPLLPVAQGGPVSLDTLHMVHRCPEILGGNEIAPGIYWGGSYDMLREAVQNEQYDPADIRLFLGYSGWSPGQLEKELEEGSWLVAEITPAIVFDTPGDETWQQAIRDLGSDFAHLLHMPTNPQLN